MKIRNGFISNSSSTSFVIRKMNNSINLDLKTRLKLFKDAKEYVEDCYGVSELDFEELMNDVKNNNKIIYCEVNACMPFIIADTLNIETLIVEINC